MLRQTRSIGEFRREKLISIKSATDDRGARTRNGPGKRNSSFFLACVVEISLDLQWATAVRYSAIFERSDDVAVVRAGASLVFRRSTSWYDTLPHSAAEKDFDNSV